MIMNVIEIPRIQSALKMAASSFNPNTIWSVVWPGVWMTSSVAPSISKICPFLSMLNFKESTSESAAVDISVVILGYFQMLQSYFFCIISFRIFGTPPTWSWCQCDTIIESIWIFSSFNTFWRFVIYSATLESPASRRIRLKKRDYMISRIFQGSIFTFTFYHYQLNKCLFPEVSLVLDYILKFLWPSKITL